MTVASGKTSACDLVVTANGSIDHFAFFIWPTGCGLALDLSIVSTLASLVAFLFWVEDLAFLVVAIVVVAAAIKDRDTGISTEAKAIVTIASFST